MKDQIAIVGVGSTGFSRGDRSPLSLALEASTAAIRDAGLTAADIDGVVATAEAGAASAPFVVSSLGLTEVSHHSRPAPLIVFSLLDAAQAVFAGAADHVLIVTPVMMSSWNSRRAAQDLWRRGARSSILPVPEDSANANAYATWAGRYMHEFGVSKDPFARIAVNSRSNAAANDLAAMRKPLSFDEYHAGRMIRTPLNMYDMDYPADGADAFVVTTAQRAAQLRQPPVLIHAATTGVYGENTEDQLPSLKRHGQHVVVDHLKARSDLWIDDVDLFYPYEGFTIIALSWLETCGFCEMGGAERYLAEHWNDERQRIEIDGRIPLNTHGGSLSEGATRGTGHLREAVMQLRGQAGARQVEGAKVALVTPGGFFFNSQGAILRSA